MKYKLKDSTKRAQSFHGSGPSGDGDVMIGREPVETDKDLSAWVKAGLLEEIETVMVTESKLATFEPMDKSKYEKPFEVENIRKVEEPKVEEKAEEKAAEPEVEEKAESTGPVVEVKKYQKSRR